MKKRLMSKLLALALSASMVLSGATYAFAAEVSEVDNYALEEAVEENVSEESVSEEAEDVTDVVVDNNANEASEIVTEKETPVASVEANEDVNVTIEINQGLSKYA